MPERNPCTESGCKAYCCIGPLHFENLTREQVLKYWPNARETLSLEAEDLFNHKGVHFKRTDRGYEVGIIGPCPNISENFGCKIQEDKPKKCRDFELGKDDCHASRDKYGLIDYRTWVCNLWEEQQKVHTP